MNSFHKYSNEINLQNVHKDNFHKDNFHKYSNEINLQNVHNECILKRILMRRVSMNVFRKSLTK